MIFLVSVKLPLLLFYLSNTHAPDIKTWRSSRDDGSREVRVLSPFSLTSLFSAARSSFSLPLTAFTLDRSLPASATRRKLQLWPRARGDISSFSSISPSSSSLPPSKTLSHLLSSRRPTFEVASRLAVSCTLTGLYPRVWHLFRRLT